MENLKTSFTEVHLCSLIALVCISLLESDIFVFYLLTVTGRWAGTPTASIHTCDCESLSPTTWEKALQAGYGDRRATVVTRQTGVHVKRHQVYSTGINWEYSTLDTWTEEKTGHGQRRRQGMDRGEDMRTWTEEKTWGHGQRRRREGMDRGEDIRTSSETACHYQENKIEEPPSRIQLWPATVVPIARPKERNCSFCGLRCQASKERRKLSLTGSSSLAPHVNWVAHELLHNAFPPKLQQCRCRPISSTTWQCFFIWVIPSQWQLSFPHPPRPSTILLIWSV